MSFNRPKPMLPRFFSSFCVRTLWASVCAVTLVFGAGTPADEPLATDAWKKDGLPFVYPHENKTLEEIWTFLQSPDANHNTEMTDFLTDFATFRQQSRSLKGKIVRIEGRLLRTVFVPTQSADQTNNANRANGANVDGYYDSWILLDDEKSIPARLLTVTIPPSFQADSPDEIGKENSAAEKKPGEILYRQERVIAVGVYYRQTAFSDGDDFYTAPTVVAETFDVLSAPILAENPPSVSEPNGPFFVFQIAAVLAAVGLWLIIRRKIQRKAPTRSNANSPSHPENVPDDFAFDAKTLALLKQNDSRSPALELPADTQKERKPPILPFILGGAILFCTLANALAAETPEKDLLSKKDAPNGPAPSGAIALDLPFWEAITGLSPQRLAPENLSDETPSERSETLSRMLDRLNRNLPDSALIENLSTEQSDEFFALWPENFGRTVRFSGHVAALESESNGENGQSPRFVVTVADENQKRLRVTTSTLPKGWGKTGESALGKKTAGIGVYFRPQADDSSPEPVLLAKCPAYYDDTTSAGRLGADLTFFDHIEPISVRDLDSIDSTENVPSSGQTPPSSPAANGGESDPNFLSEAKNTDRAERSRRLNQFRLTADDTRPFYGLLAVVAQLKPGALAAEARRFSETAGAVTVVDLFNRPEKFTQAAVTFSGNIKRARRIAIHDPEVRACFGLDHYYELYLFTNDSQSYPIVCCTPTIPDGFPLGVGDDYRQNGTISGIFYKPWGFKIDAKNGENLNDLSSWIAVPLLIAGDLDWQPEKSSPIPSAPSSRLILILFFAMAAAWWLYRRLRPKRKPLEFKVGEFPSDFPRQS